MPRRVLGLVLASLVLLPLSLRGEEGKLQEVREEVREPKKEKRRKRSCDEDDAGSGLLSWFLGGLFSSVTSSSNDSTVRPPSWYQSDGGGYDGYRVDGAYLASPSGPPAPATPVTLRMTEFLPYPYAEGHAGYLSQATWHEDPLSSELPPPVDLKSWSARLALEESNDFDGLNRVSVHALVESIIGLGVQTSWFHLTENLDDTRSDHLLLGDLNLTVRWCSGDAFALRSGIGARMFADTDVDFGFNFTTSFDVFPCRPVVLSGLLDVGTLGHAGLLHGRFTMGYLWRHGELYCGYDFFRIGSVDLHGPVIGLRGWF